MIDYNRIVENCTSASLRSRILNPLCGGNCGMFSLALSKLMTENNIDHNYFHATMKNTISDNHLDFNPCFHIGIQIDNKVVDFKGIRSLDAFKEDVSTWDTCGIKPLFSSSNKSFSFMEKYIETWTCHRTPWSFFYNIIKEIKL